MAKVGQVFISYDSEDTQFAHRLADDLRRLGVQVWIAPDSIQPGEGWVAAIERGLGESSYMLVVLTPAAVESQWVRKETDVAIALERKGRMQVIPLDVKSCAVPLLLGSYQMVSLRREYNVGLRQIAEIVGLRLPVPSAKGPSRPPEPLVAVPEPEMILIPAGEFLMGSDPQKDKDASSDEQPQHTLYLPDYYMAKTLVTNVQYAAFVERTNHRQPKHWKAGKPLRGKGGHPVVNVSWYDAIVYCNWLAKTTGKLYRLPSEAEWEKGARGIDGRIYPWGDEWDAKRCNTTEGGKGSTTPVGAYPEGASPYGLLDMSGNVWEWMRSKKASYPYLATDGREDLGGSAARVVRGGSWAYNERNAHCAYRIRGIPGFFNGSLGFRVVVSLASSES